MTSEEYTNLDRAIEITTRITALHAVLGEIKKAFVGDDLDGGWKAALTHPLYLRAVAEIADLRNQLKGLI